MDAKNVLYAAVGAPVIAARKVGEKAGAVGTRLTEHANDYGKTFEKAVGNWAAEGEKVVGRIGDKKVVDDIASKVDLDQAKEQVSKLRDQLEEMLATWRTSFRPEGETKTDEPAEKPAAKKPAAKKPAAKSTSAKTTKTSAAKTTRSTAAKTDSEKASSASKATKAS